MGAGRPDKYETNVEPRLDDIAEWAKTATDADIADALDVGRSTFAKYKQDHEELAAALKKGRIKLIRELYSALFKRALGFTYEERKIVEDEDGKNRVEVTTKYCPPDVGALHLALKNYDRYNWSNDWQHYELRKKELELQERRVEAAEW